MSKPSHTPTPWRVFDVLTDIEIVTDQPTAAATISIVQFKGQRNAQADAAFIVRACNAHDVLFDALKDLVERERSEAADSGFSDDEMTWLEDARRAIAKAKGGAA